jgi:hypothetical protein
MAISRIVMPRRRSSAIRPRSSGERRGGRTQERPSSLEADPRCSDPLVDGEALHLRRPGHHRQDHLGGAGEVEAVGDGDVTAPQFYSEPSSNRGELMALR